MRLFFIITVMIYINNWLIEYLTKIVLSTIGFDVAWHPRLYLLAYATGLGVDTLRDRDRDNVSVRIFGYSG